MCNLAGYIGTERAAPILIDMIRRQEGLNGGYYTGIATLTEDGRLHYAKVVGDVALLLEETDAINLPGNVGIMHSRTPSGGDREWAHPFVASDHSLAYIANGNTGLFDIVGNQNELAARLADAGYPFLTRAHDAVGDYPLLSDGSCVHFSEVMCRLIEALIAEGETPALAMRNAYLQFPAEIVGLMIHTSLSASIIASRVNQPLVIGRQSGGWLLASTALAFPDDAVDWMIPMAPSCTAHLSPEGLELHPFELPIPVADPIPWSQARERVLELLSSADDAGLPLRALKDGTRALWPDGRLAQAHMMLYEVLRTLRQVGDVEFTEVRLPGAAKGITAPETRVKRR